MKPTQDKKLRDEITTYVYENFTTWKERWFINLKKVDQDNWRTYGDDICKIIEKRGYHIGLPSIIEEALNSGDGVYRP